MERIPRIFQFIILPPACTLPYMVDFRVVRNFRVDDLPLENHRFWNVEHRHLFHNTLCGSKYQCLIPNQWMEKNTTNTQKSVQYNSLAQVYLRVAVSEG